MKNMNNNINEDINNQRILSFEDVNKNIDYSPIDEELRKSNLRKSILQKASIGLASVVLVVGTVFVFRGLDKKTNKIPYELGTYTYTSQVGEIEGLDFSEQSYIVLSEEELSGPGTFVIENDEQDWVVYGSFNECYFESSIIITTLVNKEMINFEADNYQIDFMYGKSPTHSEIAFKIIIDDEIMTVYFVNNQ